MARFAFFLHSKLQVNQCHIYFTFLDQKCKLYLLLLPGDGDGNNHFHSRSIVFFKLKMHIYYHSITIKWVWNTMLSVKFEIRDFQLPAEIWFLCSFLSRRSLRFSNHVTVLSPPRLNAGYKLMLLALLRLYCKKTYYNLFGSSRVMPK